jgi:hypothetical protein
LPIGKLRGWPLLRPATVRTGILPDLMATGPIRDFITKPGLRYDLPSANR